jgi:hypothetical protein
MSSSPGEQWVNYLAQGQNDTFLPCQLGDSIQQPFGYWTNTLTTRVIVCVDSDLLFAFSTFHLFKVAIVVLKTLVVYFLAGGRKM